MVGSGKVKRNQLQGQSLFTTFCRSKTLDEVKAIVQSHITQTTLHSGPLMLKPSNIVAQPRDGLNRPIIEPFASLSLVTWLENSHMDSKYKYSESTNLRTVTRRYLQEAHNFAPVSIFLVSGSTECGVKITWYNAFAGCWTGPDRW